MEIHNIDSFLDYWARIHERTARVIACIPDNLFAWTYRAGKFTLADLIRHLAAAERYMFVENACGRPSRYPGHGPELAADPAEVLALYARLHQESVDLLRPLPPDRLAADCLTPGGARLKVWKWLRAMLEHEIHHRGQIYLYLSLLEVPTPPLYGLTSEEVRARSLP